MKRKFLLPVFALSLCFVISSCSSSVEPESSGATQELQLHVQSYFNNDNVKVELDGESVFYGVVSTGDVIGVAKIVTIAVDEGKHIIKVDVNGEVSAETTINVDQPLFVGITYNDGKLAFSEQTSQFIYD